MDIGGYKRLYVVKSRKNLPMGLIQHRPGSGCYFLKYHPRLVKWSTKYSPTGLWAKPLTTYKANSLSANELLLKI